MNRHTQWMTALGLIALAIVVTVSSLFYSFFEESFRTVANTNTTDTTASVYDPLVTTVPKEARGGKPQPLTTDPQRGADQPDVVIVEFGNFECEACATMQPVVERIVTEYPDQVLHVWKDFPIPSSHPYSQAAAEAARCAQEQNAFWEYHDELFELQETFILQPWEDIADRMGLDTEAFSVCLDTHVKESLVVQGYFIARTFEIEETPAYFINETLVTGAKTYEEFKALVDAAITKAN